jgi:hypothetical protein
LHHPGSSFTMMPSMVAWLVTYFVLKLAARAKFGVVSWDFTSLAHNVLTVLLGGWGLWIWQMPAENACPALSDGGDFWAIAILLQVVHCVSDFVVYWDEMLKQPVFIYHHGVLALVASILPSCPGCLHTVTAFTIAEFGSGTIAVDVEWRRLGLASRGNKRLVFFGGSRLLNLWLLYQILLVTPHVQYWTLSSGGGTSGEPAVDLLTVRLGAACPYPTARPASICWGTLGIPRLSDRPTQRLSRRAELATVRAWQVNVPVCLLASAGGSAMMLVINGVTWFRMFDAYRRHKNRRESLGSKQSLQGRFKKAVDVQLAVVFVCCAALRTLPHMSILGREYHLPLCPPSPPPHQRRHQLICKPDLTEFWLDLWVGGCPRLQQPNGGRCCRCCSVGAQVHAADRRGRQQRGSAALSGALPGGAHTLGGGGDHAGS